jgi:hypothetical protein
LPHAVFAQDKPDAKHLCVGRDDKRLGSGLTAYDVTVTPPQIFRLSRQFKIASVNVDGKRSLDQLNGHHERQVSTSFLNPSSYPLERASSNTDGVACGYRRMRRKRCVLGSDAEGVHLLIVYR